MEYFDLENGSKVWHKGNQSLLLDARGNWELATLGRDGGVKGMPVGLREERALGILALWGGLRDFLQGEYDRAAAELEAADNARREAARKLAGISEKLRII